MVMTYNSMRAHGIHPGKKETPNYGGYSGSHVCHEDFVIKIPAKADLTKIAPVLCAGITVWEPLVNHGATTQKGLHIGVAGIGGLGTMGLKLAKALGHTVYAITHSKNKVPLMKEKGADHVVLTSDPESVKQY